jgi:hypothetical protein
MWLIDYSGICCDTGLYSRIYRFDSYEDAADFYEKWLASFRKGDSWSDGPDFMSPPYEAPPLMAG